jgi:hypothetical protein
MKTPLRLDAVTEPFLAKIIHGDKKTLFRAIEKQKKTGLEHGVAFTRNVLFSGYSASPIYHGDKESILTPKHIFKEKNQFTFHTHPKDEYSRIPSVADLKTAMNREFPHPCIIGTTDRKGSVVDAYLVKIKNGRIPPLTALIAKRQDEKKHQANLRKIWNRVDLR